MYFKRTLHPVGQGAFFSEQFFDSSNQCLFSVIYDCGSTSKGLLNHEIEQLEKSIDIMFISHFDNDHINGLKTLIEKKLLRATSVVVIPFIYPKLIKILLPEMKYELSEESFEALEALFNSDAKIIGLEDNNSFTPSNLNQNDTDNNIQTLFLTNDYDSVSSFTRFCARIITSNQRYCWYYVPFNTITDDGRKERFLEELVKAIQSNKELEALLNKLKSSAKKSKARAEKSKATAEELKAAAEELLKVTAEELKATAEELEASQNKYLKFIINYLLGNRNSGHSILENNDNIDKFEDSDDFIKFTDILKDLYKKASPGIKGVTAINVNSLNLVSYSSDLSDNNSYQSISYQKDQFELRNRHPFPLFKSSNRTEHIYQQFMANLRDMDYYCNSFSHHSLYSCLYTGDCVMEDHFFKCLDAIISSIKRPICLLQIPHHGRGNNYDEKVLSMPIQSVFINFNSTHKANDFVKKIEKDCLSISRPCFEITQEEDSRYTQKVHWEESLFK